MNISFFFFRTVIISELSFDELKSSFVKKIGLRFIKGNVEKDYISLFYIFDSYGYRKMKLQRIPAMQFTIDKSETKNGKQVIHFKRANYASLILLAMIVGINVFVNSVVPLGPSPGIITSVILYLIFLGLFNQQLGQFKEELKLIKKEFVVKNKNFT